MTSTVGKVLLKFYTPTQFHHLIDDHLMDKKGIAKLCEEIAAKAPDKYSAVMSDLARLGFEVATRQGTSITLSDLVSPVNKDSVWKDFEAFRDKTEKSHDSESEKERKVFEHYDASMKKLDKELLDKGLASNKSLAKIILAGARGSVAQYRGTIATQGVVVDVNGRPRLDVPIKSSYAEGLTLPEYLVTSFGARTGEVLKKIGVAQGGYGCLAESCHVVLADFTTKSIKDVQVGDIILGADLKGQITPTTVTAKFNSGRKETWNYVFRSDSTIGDTCELTCTEDHKLAYFNLEDRQRRGRKQPAGSFRIRSTLRLLPAKLPALPPAQKLEEQAQKLRTQLLTQLTRHTPYQLSTVEYAGEQETWDIEVSNPDHLFMLSNGLIVSNSKQFARALMPLQIVENDCGTQNGISVPTKDRESVGSYLAQAYHGYNRNQEVTVKMLNDLEGHKIEKIIVRSPMTCQSNKKHHSGGLCQLCVGKREKGMAAMDSYIGLVAGTALAEPLTESCMKARQSGGAASSLSGNQGFKLINQLANIPKSFLGKAPLSHTDGTVTSLTEAAAGGHFVTVNDTQHYIGLDQKPLVKEGDRVEQGQALSTGLIDPRDAVRLRGIGDGRKYYMEAMKKAFDDANLFVNRRNFELVAKAAVDHVKITDPNGIGDYLPDEVVSYSAIEKEYVPREDAKELRVDQAYGKYLERPELHHTIGTKITSFVLKDLRDHKVQSVLVHDQPPHFEPHMVRLLDVPEIHDDWMHVLNSTNLAKRFVNMVNKGATSDVHGSSPVPGLAYGVGFGLKKDKHP